MADVRDWGAFLRGRWNWTREGYEAGFPRGCQFTDVDAAVEFDGHRLIIEPKHYDGVGPLPDPYSNTGQMLYLRDEVKLGKSVFMLFGCGPCNDPYAALEVGTTKPEDVRHAWWQDQESRLWLPKEERRKRLKRLIDVAMGVTQEAKRDRNIKAESDWPIVAQPGAGRPPGLEKAS